MAEENQNKDEAQRSGEQPAQAGGGDQGEAGDDLDPNTPLYLQLEDPPSDFQAPKLPAVIAIPQISPAATAPFPRCFPPQLCDEWGIPPEAFVSFIDEINMAFTPNPFSKALKQTGRVLGFTPEPLTAHIGQGMQYGSMGLGKVVDKGHRVNFVKDANERFFEPRGLGMEVLDVKELRQLLGLSKKDDGDGDDGGFGGDEEFEKKWDEREAEREREAEKDEKEGEGEGGKKEEKEKRRQEDWFERQKLSEEYTAKRLSRVPKGTLADLEFHLPAPGDTTSSSVASKGSKSAAYKYSKHSAKKDLKSSLKAQDRHDQKVEEKREEAEKKDGKASKKAAKKAEKREKKYAKKERKEGEKCGWLVIANKDAFEILDDDD